MSRMIPAKSCLALARGGNGLSMASVAVLSVPPVWPWSSWVSRSGARKPSRCGPVMSRPPEPCRPSVAVCCREPRVAKKVARTTGRAGCSSSWTDSSSTIPPKATLASQSLMVAAAKAGYDKAVLARQAAEVALKEYQEGTFIQEKQACETEIKLAKAELEARIGRSNPPRNAMPRSSKSSNGSVRISRPNGNTKRRSSRLSCNKRKPSFTLESAQSN